MNKKLRREYRNNPNAFGRFVITLASAAIIASAAGCGTTIPKEQSGSGRESPHSAVNARDAQGRTALMRAVLRGDEEAARVSLDAKADVNIKDEYGKTALTQAVQEQDFGMVRLLVSAKADVNIADEEGWTALMHAVWFANHDMVRVLLSAKADVHATNRSGETAFDLTADPRIIEQLRNAEGRDDAP